MATQHFDYRGLKCPQPTLKMMSEALKLQKGDILEVVADCPTFEKDVKGFCDRMHKALLWVRPEGGSTRCQVRV